MNGQYSTVCRNSCWISSWENQCCWVVFTKDTLPETTWWHILHSRAFQTPQFVLRRRSATGLSSATGTQLCRTSYCTRRWKTSCFDWTAPASTSCGKSVDAWHNTTLAWPTNCVTSGKIFCSKWPVTVPTIHDLKPSLHPTLSSIHWKGTFDYTTTLLSSHRCLYIGLFLLYTLLLHTLKANNYVHK